jgi:hypothetical protein
MNIFVLSENVKEAAEWHVDRHVVKMPLETAQMLCTALSLNGNSNVEYKPAFFKHPCTIWAAATRDNFEWLCRLGVELCSEYTYRYEREHASEKVIRSCYEKYTSVPSGALTSFAQAMPLEYKSECAIAAYRLYYVKGKSHLASWKKRSKPTWFKE